MPALRRHDRASHLRRLLACLLCAACARLTLAIAEEAPPDPDLATKDMRRAGPVRLRPSFLLKDVGYDDNVRFDAQTRQGDTTATIGASLGMLLLGAHRGGLRLFQEADYVTFARNDDLNHWNGQARARGILLIKRAVLSLEDHFTSERERWGTEIDQRIRRTNNAITAEARLRREGRLGARAFVRNEKIDYASGDPGATNVGDLLNRDESTLALIGELRALPKTTLTLEGDLRRIDFEDRSLGRDSRSRALLPGLRFDPSASVQGELKFGAIDFTARDQPQNDYRGAIGEGRLSARMGRAGRVKLGFNRDLVFSIVASNLYYVGTSWSAAYEQFFSARMSGELLYGRGLSHYPQEVGLAEPVPRLGIRDDRFTNYQVTLRCRLNPQLWLNLSGSRLVRDSTDDALDRSRNLYGFSTSYAF